jgi:REP element-mobilizing transposase RayT
MGQGKRDTVHVPYPMSQRELISVYYIVAVCCQNRECLFGKIENGKMILNEYGEIAKNTWNELP